MKFYLETTAWPGGGSNHIYLMTDDRSKIVAYVASGTSDVFKFKNPIPFSTRGRTFKEIPNTFGYDLTEDIRPIRSNVQKGVRVIGSRGDVYYVTTENGAPRCSCSGFAFRRKCKHIDTLK